MRLLLRALAAVSYGDRHALAAAWRLIRTRPSRLVLWSLYAVGIAAFAAGKVFTPASPLAPSLAAAADDLWVCGALIAAGVIAAAANARWIGAFTTRAEPLMLNRAAVSRSLLAAYLTLRATALLLWRAFGRFAYLLLIAVPSGAGPRAFAALLAFYAGAAVAAASMALPRALARGAARRVFVVAGLAFIAAGVLPLVSDLARIVPLGVGGALLQSLPQWHPGRVLVAVSQGDIVPIAAMLAVAACALAGGVVRTRSAFPELYALSIAHFEARALEAPPRTARSKHAGRALADPGRRVRFGRGVLALVTLDALSFVRSAPPVQSLLTAAGALAAGAGYGVFVRHMPWLQTIAVYWVPGYVIAIASSTTLRLAPVLRMPLFWLGRSSTAARLGAWSCGPFARDAALFALAICGYAVQTRTLGVPALAFVAGCSLLALSRAVGLAVFALLPNALDQAGPALMVRAALMALLLAPVVIAFLAGLAFSGTAAALTAAALAAIESVALVAIAGRRLTGAVDRLSLPSRGRAR